MLKFNKEGLLGLLLLFCMPEIIFAISSNSNIDPYPVYTTLDPQDYMLTQTKRKLKNEGTEEDPILKPRILMAFSPFIQTADIFNDFNGVETYLGNLYGKWNMVGLLYNSAREFTAADYPELYDAYTNAQYHGGEYFYNSFLTDPEQKFAFFDVMTEYKKYGVRFELDALFSRDLEIKLQAGVVDVNFKLTDKESVASTTSTAYDAMTGFKNLTETTTTYTAADGTTANSYLMDIDQLKLIMKEIELEDINSYHKAGVEDVRLGLLWHHPFEINKNKKTWPKLLFIPFISADGVLGVGKAKKTDKIFSLPFGNNKHHAIGATGGFNFDFYDTIEIGAHVGYTYFFKRDIDGFHLPTSKFQSGIYPFYTNITYEPGYNWDFGFKMNAYHFLDRLSCFTQYIIVDHSKDTITIRPGAFTGTEPTDAHPNTGLFVPSILEEHSDWNSQFLITALSYDVSENINLGFLWELPTTRKNAFKTNTWMISFNATF